MLSTHYYLFDRLGSVVALTDSQGNAVNRYLYDPYGNHLAGTTEAVSNPWQYAGGFRDAFSGYYKFGTRYYDPQIGRWTQPDPSGLEANSYAYAAGNPVNFVDPTGMVSCDNNRICRGARKVGSGAYAGAKKAASTVQKCLVDYVRTCSTNITTALFPVAVAGAGVSMVSLGTAVCVGGAAGTAGLSCIVGGSLVAAGGTIGAGGVLMYECWFGAERAACYQPLLEE